MKEIKELSAEFLQLIKLEGDHADTASVRKGLATYSMQKLEADLVGDADKKAFWINLYNAYSQYFLRKAPDLIATRRSRFRHFRARKVQVAGIRFSLNDIEHRILRRSKFWWSKGYLTDPFPADWEKRLRVNDLDPRIHFALNCGGASCPPIFFYTSDEIEEQLDIATHSFLDTEVEYVASENIVRVSRILDWYIGDFGGKKGLVSFFKKYEKLPEEVFPKIQFLPYDWQLKLEVLK